VPAAEGPYAISMLGLNEVMRVLVSYFEGLTGGGLGLSLPTLYASVAIYYAMGLAALAATGAAHVIITSRFGLRLMTIREEGEEAMGIDAAATTLRVPARRSSRRGRGLFARDLGHHSNRVFSARLHVTMSLAPFVVTVWGRSPGRPCSSSRSWWARSCLHQVLRGDHHPGRAARDPRRAPAAVPAAPLCLIPETEDRSSRSRS
jgi:hypothetical protein